MPKGHRGQRWADDRKRARYTGVVGASVVQGSVVLASYLLDMRRIFRRRQSSAWKTLAEIDHSRGGVVLQQLTAVTGEVISTSACSRTKIIFRSGTPLLWPDGKAESVFELKYLSGSRCNGRPTSWIGGLPPNSKCDSRTSSRLRVFRCTSSNDVS